MARTSSSSCGFCHRGMLANQKEILCDSCNFYIHMKCNDISYSEYKELEKEPDDVSWFCTKCTLDMFPFGSLANDELLVLCDFDLLSFMDSAPSFEITSNLMDLPHLCDYDID